MKCPNCGAELKADVYRSYPKKGQLEYCLYCESGDFVDGECPHGDDVVWWLQQPAEGAANG